MSACNLQMSSRLSDRPSARLWAQVPVPAFLWAWPQPQQPGLLLVTISTSAVPLDRRARRSTEEAVKEARMKPVHRVELSSKHKGPKGLEAAALLCSPLPP